jgi:hypothetical protein
VHHDFLDFLFIAELPRIFNDQSSPHTCGAVLSKTARFLPASRTRFSRETHRKSARDLRHPSGAD